MNPALKEIPERIQHLAEGALRQANTHAAYYDLPDKEHWESISVLNTAHAGELFLKAIIAREHPLLIFKDLFSLDEKLSPLDLSTLIKRGKTHDFEKLPQVLWATTGKQVPDRECFERLRRARNSIQHFCAPDQGDFRLLSLEFIYKVIDPLIAEEFGLCAIEFIEDLDLGYDHLVRQLLVAQLKFTVPDNFDVNVEMNECLENASESYRVWLQEQMTRIERLDLLD